MIFSSARAIGRCPSAHRATQSVWLGQLPGHRRDTPARVSHLILILKTTVQSMATSSRRRLRGTARDNVQLNTLVPQQDKDFVFDLAKRMGMSTGEAMELFIAHLRTEVDRDGLPSWFNCHNVPEALPIAKAS